MESTWSFLQEMIQLYVIALIGFTVRKKGILNQATDQVLTQLILYVTLPALILFSLAVPFSYALMNEFLLLLAMSAYILLVAVLLARWMRRRSNLSAHKGSVYEGLIIFGNQGYIGFAVIFALFGEEGIVYLTLFNIIYFILIWTYGIYLFSKDKKQVNWKRIVFNPGILATLTGMLVLLFPVSWPGFVANTLESVGKTTVPLSMILIGSLIAGITFRDIALLMKDMYLWLAALTKLLVMPLLLLPFMVFSVPSSLLLIAVLTTGMPSAPTMSLYAQKFASDAHFASIGVMISSVLSIVTIPLLYAVVHVIYM